MPDRILVNDRSLLRAGAGVPTYLRQVMRHWPEDGVPLEGFCARRVGARRRRRMRDGVPDAEHRITLEPLATGIAGGRRRGVPGPIRTLLESGYARVSRSARGAGIVAAWEPNHLAVACRPPVVTTVHDLSVLDHPEWHPADRVRQWERRFRVGVDATAAWLVPSAFTRDRMVDVLGVPVESVHVTPLAPRPLPEPAFDRVERPDPYVLVVGTIEPRKNHRVLLDAWAARSGGGTLIVAGARGWGDAAHWRGLSTHPAAGEVRMTGYVDDAALATLLAGAEAVLVPSRYEGFGLPVLEAMDAGAPVICSSIPVFREVGGDAATYVDPDDPEAWAAAIDRALDDESWRKERRRAGLEHAAQFSWSRTAAQTAAVFGKVVSGEW